MAEAQHDGRRQDRPLYVTLVILGVFSIGLANGWRAIGLFRQSSLLLEMGAVSDPRPCAIGALAWAILLIGLALAMWQRKRYTRLVVPVILLAYGFYHFVLPGPCIRTTQFQGGWSVSAAAYAIAFLFATLALNARASRAYFEGRRVRARQSRRRD